MLPLSPACVCCASTELHCIIHQTRIIKVRAPCCHFGEDAQIAVGHCDCLKVTQFYFKTTTFHTIIAQFTNTYDYNRVTAVYLRNTSDASLSRHVPRPEHWTRQPTKLGPSPPRALCLFVSPLLKD